MIRRSFVLACCVVSSLGHAYSINTVDGLVDVGSIDSFVSATSLSNQDPDTQLTWVNSVLSADTEFTVRQEELEISDFFVVNDVADDDFVAGDLFAFQLLSEPSHFLVKNGSDNVALFANLSRFDWAVLSYSQLQSYGVHLGNMSELEISHVSEFGGVIVSEPATLGLFGLGLFGLVLARRQSRH